IDEPVALERLMAAMDRVVRYHDMLRVRLDEQGGLRLRDVDAEYVVHGEQAPDGLQAEELSQYLRSLQTRVDITGGPVVALAAGLVEGRQFAVAIHHLAVDVVSWTILLDDLMSCLADPHAELPPKTMSYP